MKTLNIIKINKKDIIKHTADKDHLAAQIKYPSRIVEDKRKKKVKHKGKLEENNY